MQDVMGIVLGGGQGNRLFPLTKLRSKPAVPLVGKYRIIDIPISNCLNSGINQIFALTQFNSASLNRHIVQTYKFDMFNKGFVDILAAEQTPESANWFQGQRMQSGKASNILRHTKTSGTYSSFQVTNSTKWISGISSDFTNKQKRTLR